MNGKLVAILGFVAFSLSPSFIDWKEAPESRHWFVLYYAVGIVLVYFGLDHWTAKEG
jgi:hypothetical protein